MSAGPLLFLLLASPALAQRTNRQQTILASSARTTETDSADLANLSGRGVTIVVKITADPGTASITPNIAMKDPATGDDVVMWTAAAALTGVGTTIYQLYPGALAADFDGTEAVSIALPLTWIFRMTVADAESMTYSVGASVTN